MEPSHLIPQTVPMVLMELTPLMEPNQQIAQMEPMELTLQMEPNQQIALMEPMELTLLMEPSLLMALIQQMEPTPLTPQMAQSLQIVPTAVVLINGMAHKLLLRILQLILPVIILITAAVRVSLMVLNNQRMHPKASLITLTL